MIKININNIELIKNVNSTFLTAIVASGASTLTVQSINGFAINQILLIGEIGSEKTEIIKTHASTAPSGNIVTLASNTVYSHSKGTKIYIIPYDQYELSHATTSTGTKTLLSTTLGSGLIAINPEALETYYYDTEYSIGGYFVRKKNSIGSNFSNYSDYIPYTGFTNDTVYSIKRRALLQLGEEIGNLITDEFLNESLWEARRDLDQERKRWSFRTAFNTDIGDISEGAYSVSVPSTLRNPDSPQNILGLRLGDDGRNLSYISKRKWDEWFQAIPHTTIATQPSVGDTTLVITNSRDFASSGTVQVGSNAITYTGNTIATGTLTGVPSSGTGSITATHAVAIDVWQNISFATPQYYTIFEDTIYFSSPFENALDGMNIWMDLYRTLPEYDSDGDTLDEPQYDLFVHWLKWRIKDLKSKGKLKPQNDGDYLEWIQGKEKIKRLETLNQDVGFSPDISHLIDEE